MNQIRVRLFAAAREVTGLEEFSLSCQNEFTVAEVCAQLERDHPPLAPVLARSLIAVNQRYAAPNELVRSGDEVAVIPPVAGG